MHNGAFSHEVAEGQNIGANSKTSLNLREVQPGMLRQGNRTPGHLGRECQARFVVAVGGGKTIDTGKIVANRLGVPVAVVPTIASTDAPCSACAVVYSEEGVVVRVEYQKKNPDLVLVDSEIIANAPERFLVAGMGDALATWFEAESCRKAKSKNEAGELGSLTAYALARLCYDTLLES